MILAHVPDPIIITGCARSGTSLIAGTMHLCGAWVGNVTGPTSWNRKGQFENEFIRDRLVKPYLKSINMDPMGQDPLPSIGDIRIDLGWRRSIFKAIYRQGYDGQSTWAYKGAKACLMWPVWHVAFPRARWVIVRREDELVIDSCMKVHFMHKHKTREGWRRWIEHHKMLFSQMKQVLNVWEIWPDPERMDLLRWLVESLGGLEWRQDAVEEFVDRKLWNKPG